MGQALTVLLAKIWKGFKQKNPQIATLILVVGLTIIAGLTYSDQYELFNLPEWIKQALTVATSVLIGLNGSSTYEVLSGGESSTTADRNTTIDSEKDSF